MAMDAGGELQLLTRWVSPFSIRVKIGLAVKKLSYVLVGEDFSSRSELVVKYNPLEKKVPILLHHGRPILEARIILEYIDNISPAAGRRITPADPYDQAMARFWGTVIDEKLYEPLAIAVKTRDPAARAELLAQIASVLELLEGAFEKCSSGKDFFGGDGIGYLDLVLGSYVEWFKALEKLDGVLIIDGAKTPLLAEWAERLSAADAVKEAAPGVERVLESFKQTRARSSSSTTAAA